MNRFFSILLMALLMQPISISAANVLPENIEPNNEQLTQVNMLDDDIIENPTMIEYKTPVSKRKIAKKFLLAMSGVAVSSILLFLILTIYNRLHDSVINHQNSSEGEISLETPDDINNAIKNFMDKTNWN